MAPAIAAAKPPKEKVDTRKNFKIVKCCSNCKYSWFSHSMEKRGFCTFLAPNKKAPDRNTPSEHWKDVKTHMTLVCNKHKFTHTSWWNTAITKWVNKLFSVKTGIEEK
jgi:hypothetical protein